MEQEAVSLLIEETSGGTVVQKALTGTTTLSHGLKAKTLLLLSSSNTTRKALLYMLRSKTSQLNIFHSSWKKWELARVALSGHRDLDYLCQEMHEAW